jgi:hypothetical protein
MLPNNTVARRAVAGSNLETDNETTFTARQQIFNKQEYVAIAG